MADDKRESSPPGGKRRRPAPTIDLKATEIASEPVKSAEPIDPPQETPRAEAPPIAPGETPRPDPPPPQSQAKNWRPEWLDVAAMTNRMAGWRDAAAERMDWRLIAAGGAGAVAMLAVGAIVWALMPGVARDDGAAARLAALEKQLRDLGSRPQPASADPRALADLAARIDRAEAAASAPRAAQPDQALINRVAALETATRPLAELTQRADAANTAARDAKTRADAAFEAAQKNAAPPPQPQVARSEIDALATRLAALEQSAKTIDERIARATAASAGADKPARLAFTAVTLRAAVESGAPFGQELAAAKSLAPDAAALAPLEPLAATGLPSTAALARELKEAVPQLLMVTKVAREVGLVDRLQQNAERLVRIRPVSEAAGDEPSAVLARADAKAAQGDIAGALDEVTRLPEVARAGLAGWIKRAQLRIAGLAAARKFAAGAVDALKAGP